VLLLLLQHSHVGCGADGYATAAGTTLLTAAAAAAAEAAAAAAAEAVPSPGTLVPVFVGVLMWLCLLLLLLLLPGVVGPARGGAVVSCNAGSRERSFVDVVSADSSGQAHSSSQQCMQVHQHACIGATCNALVPYYCQLCGCGERASR
jgi:hypothetical protein